MQIIVSKAALPNVDMALRRAGYGSILDRNTRAARSYVRRIHGDQFPRFHLYVEEGPEVWHLNLHLDQRAPVYGGQTAHAGEYDGSVVENEAARIQRQISA